MPWLSLSLPEVSLMQPESWLFGLIAFAFVSSITPGPNNVLLAASGARFGSGRTLSHAAGIWTGMVMLLSLAVLGVGAVATMAPVLFMTLQMLAGLALVMTAIGMVRERPAGESPTAQQTARPWSFWQAVGFQYLNPKALMMAVTAAAMIPHGQAEGVDQAGVMIATFMLVSMPCTWVWVMAGAGLRQALNSPTRKRTFNWIMAGLLIATIPLSLAPLEVLS